ncbi:MAG: DUF11 domain-containing protein [Leptodesmis sp.]|uniref:DUF11 domain-containing protein n=1 Tax=Leptodesmis sp. TaxID=3100501 RepID=UPI003D1412EA
MKRFNSVAASAWVRLGVSTGGLALAALGAGLKPAFAQITTLPSNPNINFQTSAPGRCANVGDWYTTNGSSTSFTTPGATQVNTAPPLCSPTDPNVTSTSNPPANRLHRFLISITPEDLAASGGSVTIRVEDAGTGGLLDEVDGSLPPFGPIPPVYDPTRFRLLGPTGAIIETQTLTPQTNPADIGRTIQFAPITQPGVYTVTSETGEYAIAGYDGPFNPTLNNDDNGFRIVVNGVPDLLIGQYQGTFQNNVPGSPTLNFFFLVGPGTSNVFIRNFDLDSSTAGTSLTGPGGENSTISYSSPTTAIIPGTTSGNAFWNNSGNLNTGGDSLAVAGLANAGRWGIQLNGYGTFSNQSLLEANNGTQPDPQQRLPVLDRPPTRAGNFVITPPTERQTQIGQTICHPFSVINFFFTTDIINLSTAGTDPNYTVEFRDADGTTVLTDTDGDGAVDTGILAALGGTRNLNLCVTPRPGAPPIDNTTIVGISFMDQRIRQQAVSEGIPGAVATPQPQTVLKITRIGEGGGTGAANLLLVKRITNITRGGTVLPGVNFGEVINDPAAANDDDPGWAQIPLTGIIALPITNPVQSGDEVTYTVYFLSNGTTPALDVSICDLIPGGTTFIPNSLQLQNGNASPVSVGTFFTPLAPLPNNNSCPIQTNPNGAAIVNLGTVSNAAGSNFGFIRFRVRVN